MEYYLVKNQQHIKYEKCPIESVLGLIQGKWKVVILLILEDEMRRFNELSRLLPNITQRMLTNQLRELEKDGLIHRKVYREVPPKVEYSLTELAISLIPILLSIKEWGEENLFS
jgi:DNA-binding HxlR family transcriptional regulator